MALSEYEKQVLAEMEQELRKQDPGLADVMATSLPEQKKKQPVVKKEPLSPRKIAVGAILVAIGLATVLGGMTFAFSAWTVVFGAIGFLAMVGGVLYALAPDKDAAPTEEVVISSEEKKAEREEQRRRRWENRGM